MAMRPSMHSADDYARRRPVGAQIVLAFLIWCAAGLIITVFGACVYPATEVIVVLDTDVPLNRLMAITVTVRASGSTGGAVRRWYRGSGADGGIQIPGATFSIVPRPGGPLDEAVTVIASADVFAGPGGEPATRIERTVRFRMVPRRQSAIGIFIAAACGASSTGCSSVPATECTATIVCNERGLTCGAGGRCEGTGIEPTPPDAGSPMDVLPRDASDAMDACAAGRASCGGSCVDLMTDPANCGSCSHACPAMHSCLLGACYCTPDCSGRRCGPDPLCGADCGSCPTNYACQGGNCVCVPNCGSRVCGRDPVCGTSCGSCASTEFCDGQGHCRCAPQCSGRECGDDSCGGSCGSCMEGFGCDASGTCVCGVTSDWRLVGGACLPSCGLALNRAGYNDVGGGCCPTPCIGRESPEASWGCVYCCESFAGLPACQ